MMERILIVDDEVHTVRLLQKFLTSKGYEVHTATDGREAVQKVTEVKPHVVLLDIIMPGMDGLDTLKEIKKIDSHAAIIMITAVIDEDMAKKAMQLGAFDYVTKPFDLDYVETCVLVKIIQVLGSDN
jgi:two-component system response regulator (stage 0 sporulation protein F)